MQFYNDLCWRKCQVRCYNFDHIVDERSTLNDLHSSVFVNGTFEWTIPLF